MRLSAFVLILLLLGGCTASESAVPSAPPTAAAAPLAPAPAAESVPVPTPEPAPAPTPVPTAAPVPTPSAAPAVFASYTLPLGASVPIYEGPGSHFSYVQDVGQDGVYTIVEEAVSDDGSLWGRLKSGIGWVNLSAPADDEIVPPFTAGFAYPELVASGDFARCIVDNGEYSVQLMILPHEILREVRFEMLLYGESGYTVDCICDTFPELSAARPLVADVVFYGDMTAYGVSFTDESGAERHFAITMSGFDGSLITTEYD